MAAFDSIRLAAFKTLSLGRRLFFGCKWTPRVAQTGAVARREAAAMKHDCVQATHLTVALIHIGEGLASEQLKRLGCDYASAFQQAEAMMSPGTATLEAICIPFSDEVKEVFQVAKKLSLHDGLCYFGTDHMFVALLQKPEPLLAQLVQTKGLNLEEFRRETQATCREINFQSAFPLARVERYTPKE